MRAKYLISVPALLVSMSAFPDEAFRCGQWIVTHELSVAELKYKCGEPRSKDSQTVDVRGKARSGSVARGTTTIEHWTYEFASGSRYRVTIVDGTIKSIERSK